MSDFKEDYLEYFCEFDNNDENYEREEMTPTLPVLPFSNPSYSLQDSLKPIPLKLNNEELNDINDSINLMIEYIKYNPYFKDFQQVIYSEL